MARKRFHRVRPDMGWVVGATNVSVSYPAGSPDAAVDAVTLFDFADIDPDALTGRIEADKSDWFIKRVILNFAATASLDGLVDTDWMRFFTWGLSVANVEVTQAVLTDQSPIFGPEWYNRQARILRTGVAPVYMPAVLSYASDETTGRVRIAVDSTDASLEAGFLGVAPYWGPAMQSHDWNVVAGLRNNQAVEFSLATADGPGNFDWDQNDVLSVRVWYQFLMQKRRA